MAENDSGVAAATTLQVFMLSSLHSSYKDIVGLFSVRKMDAKKLFQFTIEVLEMTNELRFEIVCLVSDNHSVNRNMFKILCGSSLKPC